MELGEALAWLDRHDPPDRPLPDRAQGADGTSGRLLQLLGDPQLSTPLLRVTGQRDADAVALAIGGLLGSKGLSVGMLLGSHLSVLNERLIVDGEPIGDEELAAVLSDLAGMEALLDGRRLGRAELLVAGALRWFSDRPVDVVVLGAGEGPVAGGSLGAGDAPAPEEPPASWAAALDALVGVETGSGGGGAVVGRGAPDGAPAVVTGWQERGGGPVGGCSVAGVDFGCSRNEMSVGGRRLDLWTPGASYEGVWLGVHGRHQGDNFATALAAGEAFFDRPLEDPLVREAAARLRLPGRLEVLGHRPVVVVAVAADPAATARATAAVDEELAACGSRLVVVGVGRCVVPAEVLSALSPERARMVIVCPAGEPGSPPVDEVAGIARAIGVRTLESESVAEGVRAALGLALPDELVLVVGPAGVIGEARVALGRR